MERLEFVANLCSQLVIVNLAMSVLNFGNSFFYMIAFCSIWKHLFRTQQHFSRPLSYTTFVVSIFYPLPVIKIFCATKIYWCFRIHFPFSAINSCFCTKHTCYTMTVALIFWQVEKREPLFIPTLSVVLLATESKHKYTVSSATPASKLW